jgi:hypothetical protein
MRVTDSIDPLTTQLKSWQIVSNLDQSPWDWVPADSNGGGGGDSSGSQRDEVSSQMRHRWVSEWDDETLSKCGITYTHGLGRDGQIYLPIGELATLRE